MNNLGGDGSRKARAKTIEEILRAETPEQILAELSALRDQPAPNESPQERAVRNGQMLAEHGGLPDQPARVLGWLIGSDLCDNQATQSQCDISQGLGLPPDAVADSLDMLVAWRFAEVVRTPADPAPRYRLAESDRLPEPFGEARVTGSGAVRRPGRLGFIRRLFGGS